MITSPLLGPQTADEENIFAQEAKKLAREYARGIEDAAAWCASEQGVPYESGGFMHTRERTPQQRAAAIRALSHASGVAQVKPLVWERGIVEYAKPLPGMKYVACSTAPHGSWAWWLDGDNTTRTVERDEQHAKAAAQADYEARIRSALVGSPGVEK